ncbi:c-type cytochrome [Xylophilus rhododendri]|uniref:C-type cytochrome n=1 Tax=Xylophilus rhododendri TaxID=2697032 RepID=A0A857JD60_9BURK|nr:c-type cytochrome [Xylophilus rhododendri]QHJ00699.1 c-type cytochrome [Xylophilus rhododendri]
MKSPLLPCSAIALLLAIAAPAARADETLARQRNCMACHTVERKVVGPAFKAVAAKYAGQKGMADVLARKIRQGGGGVWGPVPMPANPQVSEADAKQLAGWILGLPH